MCLAFEMKGFACERELFQKIMTRKSCQNANFENGGTTTVQIDILHVPLNILSISLLSRGHSTSGYFEMQKSVILRFEVN